MRNDNNHYSYEKKPKRRKYIVLGILLILCVGAFVFVQMSKIEHIEIIGCERYSKDEIKDMLKEDTKFNNSILLYLNYKYGKPRKVPFIEYMKVQLTGINSVRVRVYEKSIFGCIKYLNSYMYFDKDGIIVDSSSERYEEIPIITGLKYNTMILSQKLNIQKDKLFDVIKDLTRLIHKYNVNIDTVYFEKDNEVVLYSKDIKILLGKKDMYDEQMAELPSMLPKIKGKKGVLHMENFETGNKTYFEITK